MLQPVRRGLRELRRGPVISGANVDGSHRGHLQWWKLSNLRVGDYDMYAIVPAHRPRVHPLPHALPLLVRRWTRHRDGVPDDTPTKMVDGETRYAFFMRPSYFYGSVRLADPYVPLHPNSPSTLESLYFEGNHDSNGDGIPNNPYIDNTRMYATAGGGSSFGGFPRCFQTSTVASSPPPTSRCSPTPTDSGPDVEPGRDADSASGPKRPRSRPGPECMTPASCASGALNLSPSVSRSTLLAPEERFRVDHEYCFNEVLLFYRLRPGAPLQPLGGRERLLQRHRLAGEERSYSASGPFYGTRAFWGYPPWRRSSRRRRVSMSASAGYLHRWKPGRPLYLMSDNGAGLRNTATFAPVSVSLGCRAAGEDDAPAPLSNSEHRLHACQLTTGPAISISGVVKSKPAVSDTVHLVPAQRGSRGDRLHQLRPRPGLRLPLELQELVHNTLQVFAYAARACPRRPSGRPSSSRDDPADGQAAPATASTARPWRAARERSPSRRTRPAAAAATRR